MRLLPVVLLLSTICGALGAQTSTAATAPAAANAQAANRFKQLADKQAERVHGLQPGAKARMDMLAARAADLEVFAKEFPKSTEANMARLEIVRLANQNKDLAEAAKTAIANFDPAQSDLKMTIQAAAMAGSMGLADKKAAWIEEAVKKATTIDERFDLMAALNSGSLMAAGRADKLLADTEAAATTDEDKAAVLMGKATMAQRAAMKDKEAYQRNLAEISMLYPATKAGKQAARKVAAAAVKAGGDPIAFTTKDIEGKDVSPADYQGKVLLIDFWATWCRPCMDEMPNVVKLYTEYHTAGFDILGVSLDREGDLARLQKITQEQHMPWRQIYDGKWWQAEIAQLHDVQTIPFTILIGKDGKVIDTKLAGEKLAAAVKQALDAK